VELVKPVRPSQLFDVLHTLLAARPEHARRLAADQLDASLERSRRGARVLVVEDNAANLKVAVRMIERLGYRADMAGNGVEAVKALGNLDYDAVLMDCQMPEMDGYDATREIRRREAGASHIMIGTDFPFPWTTTPVDHVLSTPGLSAPFGSSACLAARSAAANGAGRWRSYQGRCSRPTAWWWVIVPPPSITASAAARLISAHCSSSEPRRAGARIV